MTFIIVLVVVLAALGAAAALGWTVDSRDTDYGLGPVIDGSSARLTGVPGR